MKGTTIAIDDVDRVKVVRIYTPTTHRFNLGVRVPAWKVERDCHQGCTCSAVIIKCDRPNLRTAIADVICFNDADHRGISGKGCSGKVVTDEKSRIVFEVAARFLNPKEVI